MASDSRNRIFLVSVVAMLLAMAIGISFTPPWASAASARYAEFNVDIEVLADGRFRVRETEIVDFDGIFSFGHREIPTVRTNGITNVQVSEVVEGHIQPYAQCSTDEVKQRPHCFAVTPLNAAVYVNWSFEPTAASGETRTFLVEYDAIDALRSYPDADPPNQQLWWTAVGKELTAETPVDSSVVTVTLPDAVSLTSVTVSDGLEPGIPSEHSTDGQTFTWNHGSFASGEEFTVRLQFPFVVDGYGPPSWQETDDAQRAAQEADDKREGLIHLSEGLIALLIALGGGLALWMLWFKKGRDPKVGLVAEYVSEPPQELSAGIVGTLIDEHAEMRDVVAMVLDLARRGVVKISLVEQQGNYQSRAKNYVLEVVNPTPTLTKPEMTVFRSIFGVYPEVGDQVSLAQARASVAAIFPTVQEELYAELVAQGFFTEPPHHTRERWRNAGIVISIIAIVGGVIGVWELDWWVLIPVVAAVGFGISMMRASKKMPQKTLAGAEAAAKWIAFRRYLAELGRFEKVEKSQEIFEQNLAYATAFGLEQAWVSRFATSDVQTPGWLDLDPGRGRRHAGGDVIIWGGMPHSGGSSGSGGFDLPDVDVPDLQDLSNSAAKGLNSSSSGAMSLLSVLGAVVEVAAAFSGGGGGGSSGGGGGGFD